MDLTPREVTTLVAALRFFRVNFNSKHLESLQIDPLDSLEIGRLCVKLEGADKEWLEPFTKGYIEAMLWSSTDEHGEPLDSQSRDLSPEAQKQAERDCGIFSNEQWEHLMVLDAAQCGHDFWLTRNGHGAGFWDRGLGDVGKRLTEACKAWGSVDPYVGDDGLVYL